MSEKVLLEVKGLCFRHDHGVDALQGVDLKIRKGVRLALLGNNGAGKTTLFLHLVGILKPSAGSVLLDGAPVKYDRDYLGAWRQKVGLLLQDPEDQLFSASVEQDVSFGPLAMGLEVGDVRRMVSYSLEEMGIADLAQRPVHLLSHGQKKRVALAGILAMAPELIVMDEPTAGLDHPGQKQLMKALSRLHEKGSGVVFSTHDFRLAKNWADEVAVMDAGRLICQGRSEEVLTDRKILGLLGADDAI